MSIHSEKKAEYKKQHRDKYLAEKKRWRLKHKDLVAAHIKQYFQTAKGRVARKRARIKKSRGLGFIPLNNSFPGAVGHHIDKEKVIYIPIDMHNKNKHSLLRNKGMDRINTLAFAWLQAE